MHSRISPTAMALMHCVKPWALYDKIKIKPAWGLSSISKQIVVCSLKGQKKEQTGSTTESIRKDRCTTINNCWLSVLPTFLDLFIPKVFESTQLNWKSYISLESVPDFYASDMLLQPFPQTPKSTPVLCPLTRCWSWWCFVGGAAAISAAVVLQAVETGLMLTGGWQGATRNLQEWSSLRSSARLQFLDELFAFSHWYHSQRLERLPLLSRRSILNHTRHSKFDSGVPLHKLIPSLPSYNCLSSKHVCRCLQKSCTALTSVAEHLQKVPGKVIQNGMLKIIK